MPSTIELALIEPSYTILQDWVTPKQFGLVADGNSHPLSGYYGSLAAAQAAHSGAFYFVTSLTQQIDWAACKAASNAAFGADLQQLTSYVTVSQASDTSHIIDSSQNWTVNEHAGKTVFRKFISNGFVTSQVIASNTATTLTLAAPMSFGSIGATNQYALGYGEHGDAGQAQNKPLWLPAGRYVFGSDTWRIRNLVGARIDGAGERAVVLTSDGPVLAFDGLWYSELANFSIECQTNTAVVALDIDGNASGQPYATRGVQGVSLRNMLIDGGGSTYGFAICRTGGSGAQGSECVFEKVHLQNASFSCYYQFGFNALANTFIGGNFQNYVKHGAFINGGTAAFINTGFQSTQGYRQIENTGADIWCGDAGSFEGFLVYGCRTESLVFFNNSGAVRADIRGCNGRAALPGWFANTTYGAAAASYKAIAESARLFVATTEGTTGSSKPDFTAVATGGTVSDGTIVWTETGFDAILNLSGSVDAKTVSMSAGRVTGKPRDTIRTVTANTSLESYEDGVLVDATSGPLTITGPKVAPNTSLNIGKAFFVKKVDTSANAVTVSLLGPFEDGTSSVTIAGGSRGSKKFMWADGVGGSRAWMEVP